MGFGSRLAHAWNVFRSHEPNAEPVANYHEYGVAHGFRPDRTYLRVANDRSLIGTIYTQIAVDVASISIRHVKHDENDRFLDVIESSINERLTLRANIDQDSQAFIRDFVITLFDKGVAAIVPVDTSISPERSGSFDIHSMRVGEVTSWYPEHVRVNLYNEKKGIREEIVLAKSAVVVVENPFYNIMNESNGTLQRLIRKLSLLDTTDEAVSSTKLDLIIQLPYTIKTETKRQQAENRRIDIERQLNDSTYGIAYTDGSERITQLNRPVESNLLPQIEFLTKQLFGQLGLSQAIFDGTANEAAMINYYNRTVEPILSAIVLGMRNTFLTKTARTQGQSIDYAREPFKLVPVAQLAEIADKFTRNEVLSSNEVRALIGFSPVPSDRANELRNKNIPDAKQGLIPSDPVVPVETDEEL